MGHRPSAHSISRETTFILEDTRPVEQGGTLSGAQVQHANLTPVSCKKTDIKVAYLRLEGDNKRLVLWVTTLLYPVVGATLHYTLVKRKDLQNSSKMTSKSLKEELQVKNGQKWNIWR